MKRFTTLALVLCISMMCASLQMAQGQNRRTGGNSTGRETVQQGAQKKQPAANLQSQPRSTQQSSSAQTRKQSSSVQRQPARQQPAQRSVQPARQQPSQQYRPSSSQPRSSQYGKNNFQGYRSTGAPKGDVRPAPRPAPKPRPAPRPAPKPRPAPASIYHYGYHATALPHGAYRRVYNGIDYYYVNNVFYRRHNNVYVVCRPPVGATFAHSVIGAALTALIIRDAIDGSRYYYNNGVYYTRHNDRYTVVDAPVGALVSQLPDGYEEVEIDGMQLYRVDNVLYKTTVYAGLPYFEVVAII